MIRLAILGSTGSIGVGGDDFEGTHANRAGAAEDGEPDHAGGPDGHNHCRAT